MIASRNATNYCAILFSIGSSRLVDSFCRRRCRQPLGRSFRRCRNCVAIRICHELYILPASIFDLVLRGRKISCFDLTSAGTGMTNPEISMTEYKTVINAFMVFSRRLQYLRVQCFFSMYRNADPRFADVELLTR